jgi:hypothetical protein
VSDKRIQAAGNSSQARLIDQNLIRFFIPFSDAIPFRNRVAACILNPPNKKPTLLEWTYHIEHILYPTGATGVAFSYSTCGLSSAIQPSTPGQFSLFSSLILFAQRLDIILRALLTGELANIAVGVRPGDNFVEGLVNHLPLAHGAILR